VTYLEDNAGLSVCVASEKRLRRNGGVWQEYQTRNQKRRILSEDAAGVVGPK
jgi:hypothetical protein